MDIRNPKLHRHVGHATENMAMLAGIPPWTGEEATCRVSGRAASGHRFPDEKEGCVMRGVQRFAIVGVALFLLMGLVAEAANTPGIKTIRVDCNRGDSINQALADRADELIIEISGTCQEDVVIARDDVTLLGLGSDPTVVALANNAIWIDRASRVTLENLTVTGSINPDITGAGIFVFQSSGVVISNVQAEGNREGMRTYASTLRIVDSEFCGNSRGGLYIANGSSVIADGEEIAASQNGYFGLLLSESALRSPWPPGPRVLANDNGSDGVIIQAGATLLMGGRLEAKRNGWNGVRMVAGKLDSQYGLDVSDNEFGVQTGGPNAEVAVAGGENASVSGNTVGLYAGEGGYIFFNGILTGNTGAAVTAEGTGRVALSSTDCQGNGSGLNVHGGTAWIQESTIANNTNGDVDLSFGSRVTFDVGNTVGVVSCDDTVLVEGDVTCPEAKSARVAPPQMDWVAPMLRQPGDLMAPRLLP